ncbi:hypothetical protein P43SY_011405 [Pythium insidiosum]|uniref:Chromo domain-containing protein n=1 Tax=Pythium insidiosum TaxID=114742 RepID=A0AAD5M031_PYTIN|nr:hypothetical protein P43SY_011405 [Pythium insidiosum]
MAAKRASLCNFDVGDYVLWSRVDERLPSRKLLATWLGPFRVVETRSHSFIIEHLLSGDKYEVHGSRLKYYHDGSINITEEINEFVSEQGIELGVEALREHRYNADLSRWELRVKWIGLQEHEASWESLNDLNKSIPARVREYADNTTDPELLSVIQELA